MEQFHPGFFEGAPPFAMVAGRAGGYYIHPVVLPAQMARNDMVDRQFWSAFTAVLAGEVVAPKYLTPGKLEPRAGAVDHFLQTDHGRNRQGKMNRLNVPASIDDQSRFFGH